MKITISKMQRIGLLMLAVLFSNQSISAQTADGAAGITTAATTIAAYFGSVTTLMLAIAAIVGLIGAIRVYAAWNNGDQDINKKIMGWFGACIFIVVVGVVLESFFGVTA